MKHILFLPATKHHHPSMIRLLHLLLCILLAASFILIFCEFLIYYFVAIHCSWPELIPHGNGEAQRLEETQYVEPLHVMFLSDTHLLGTRHGHWFDKLRREWQMKRAFQTALTVANPQAVFILGDLTDEGQWASNQEFSDTVNRFHKMFQVPEDVEFHVVVGNHDIGFHQSVTRDKLRRFQEVFEIPPVKVLTIKGVNFVLVNSMAMHGDGCFMCSLAMDQLLEASEQLNCTRFGSPSGTKEDNQEAKNRCQKYKTLPNIAPILLQHYPLYRSTEAVCEGPDAPSLEEQKEKNIERYDVISKKASQQLLSWIRPRMILSGHRHHGCYVLHPGGIPELSVPSFSWRNRNNPSLIMATITPKRLEYNKCFIPQESTVISVYISFGVLMLVWVVILIFYKCGKRFKIHGM
ncbi:metallophosphoesterase 1-like [Asterias rubens]|uniref:metallophosphoesterase 1-like n=1 Tax=Asterias rubens TaxID=7604 RepID=UPI001454FDA7|nr:metallophosphoesterase 1-like [Asterias rubens]